MNILYLVSRPMWAQMYGLRNGFIANGHRVITAAPPAQPIGQHIDAALAAFDPDYHVDIECEPDEPITSLLRRLDTEPDLIFYIENMVPFLPAGLTEVDIPTVGLFSEDTKNSDWETYLLPHFDLAPRLTLQAVRNAHQLGYDNVVYWYYGGADYYHTDHGLERDVDVVLLGNFSNWHPERTATLPHLLKLRDAGYNVVVRNNVLFDEYAHWHSRARVTYNASQEACYLNFRVMEAMASGCLVVTNRVRDAADPAAGFFTDREHLVYYDSSQEAVERIREYLDPARAAERERISRAGRDRVQAQFTYADVTRQFLDEFVRSLPADFRARRRERLARLKINATRIGRDTARYFYFAGDFKRAAAVAEQLQPAPADAGTRNLKGVILAAGGQLRAGGDLVVDAINLQPANPLFHYNLAALVYAGRAQGASRAEAIDLIHRALFRFERLPQAAAAIDISDVFWPQEVGRFRLQLARALYHPHTPAEYRRLVTDAFRYQLYLMLGRLCTETGDWAQGEQAFEQAMRCLGGEDGATLAELAELYRQMGDPGRAIATLERATALEPFHYWAYPTLASLHAQAGRPAEGAALLADVWQRYPLPRDLQIQFLALQADLHNLAGDVAALRAAWERLLALDPEHPGLADRLALLPDAAGQALGAGLALTYYGRFDNFVEAYPIINHALTRELGRRGVNVQKNAGSADIAVTFIWPPQPPRPDHLINIALFCWEFSSIPDHYVTTLNSYDYVVTFSEHDRAMLRENGVQTAIVVIPLGLDQENYFPLALEREAPTFRFLFVGGTNPRHGADVALAAFKAEFAPEEDVELLMKVSVSYPALDDAVAAGYRIRVLNQPLAPRQMLRLYNAADALLYPVRGVGVGLPALEALACGLPVITTNWSAVAEYVADYNAHYTLVDAPNENGVSSVVPNRHAEPDLADVRRLMRAVFADHAAARARAAASRARLLREASYAAAAERFIAFLRGLPAVGWRTARSLEIGPGNSPHPGYEHLDVRGDLPHIEWVHDFNQPLPFEAGTFDEILSSHSIEHVSWRKVIGILKDWCRVIRPGGRVRIYTPDFEYLARKYVAGESDTNIDKAYPIVAEQELGGYDPGTWAIIKMFAGQEYAANFHAGVYDFATLARFLKLAGFAEVRRLPFVGDIHLEAIKAGPAQTLTQARAWTVAGQPALAVPALTGLVEAMPELAEAWVELGVAQLRLGRPAEAAAALTRALELEPRSQRAQNLLALARAPRPEATGLSLVASGSRVLAAPAPAPGDQRWVALPALAAPAPAPAAKPRRAVRSVRTPRLSVLLCSYNRKDNLRKCVQALNKQSLPTADYEIVLVDDGSTDGTAEVVAGLKSRAPLVFQAHDRNRGLAAARNTAIAAARGKYLLFINDDTYPEPDMLAEHVAFLEQAADPYLAALGRIQFTPPLRHLAISEAIERYNFLFPYTGLRTDRLYDFDWFVTGNIAIAKQPFLDHDLRFNETFHRYGCEDIELGFRLWRQGMRVQYNPRALAQHEHLMSAAAYWRRELANAYNQVQFMGLHPELVRRYWGVAGLSPAVVEAWRAQWERFAPERDGVLAALAEVEHQPLPALVGRTILGQDCRAPDDVLRVLAHGLRLVGDQARWQGRLECLSERPGLAAHLAGQTIIVRPLEARGAPAAPGHSPAPSRPLSVVIPTYNRWETLERCLQALSRQTLAPDQFEVVVVDDGSTDATPSALPGRRYPFEVRYFRQANAGPGAARNLGVAQARGQVVLFLGDDIYAPPELLAGHLEFHARFPALNEAVVGRVAWTPQRPVTPFMEYIVGPSGLQFAFDSIADPEAAGYRYFYTSNLSLKRAFLQAENPVFDPAYTYAAWEDIDLGYRLARRGLRLRYREALLAHHDHPTDARRFRRRQFRAGQMARVFAARHPACELAQYTTAVFQQAQPQAAALADGLLDVQLLDRLDQLEALVQQAGPDPQLLETLHQAYHLVLERAYVRGILAGPGAPETPALSRPEETLLLLTGAADLSAALEQHQARLDQDLLDLLHRLAADTADQDARQSLEALAELIRPRLAGPAPSARAVETLEWLLAQPDLPAALEQQAGRLDEDLLSLVRLNADTARADGKPELAGGLDLLADYIAAQLPRPAAAPAAETLRRLLEAEDLPAALAEQAERLDADVLALVRENAAAARADGDAELAQGLDHLADYIAGVLAERAPAAAD